MNPVSSKYRYVNTVLYRLKQDYGITIGIYRLIVGTPNYLTGAKDVSNQLIKQILKAILLPTRDIQKFQYGLSFIAANKNFTYGGVFEVGDREVIIDSKDLPKDFNFQDGDYLVFEKQRYNIVERVHFDFKAFYLIVRRTQEELPRQIISKTVKEEINPVEMLDGA